MSCVIYHQVHLLDCHLSAGASVWVNTQHAILTGQSANSTVDTPLQYSLKLRQQQLKSSAHTTVACNTHTCSYRCARQVVATAENNVFTKSKGIMLRSVLQPQPLLVSYLQVVAQLPFSFTAWILKDMMVSRCSFRSIMKKSTNSGGQVAVATKLCTVEHNICGTWWMLVNIPS